MGSGVEIATDAGMELVGAAVGSVGADSVAVGAGDDSVASTAGSSDDDEQAPTTISSANTTPQPARSDKVTP